MTKNIKDVLNKFLKTDTSWKLKLLQDWDNIIGNLKNQVKIEKIDNNILVLGVYNSSWMQELYLLSNILLKKINKSLDEPRIKKLVFKQIQKTKNKEYKKMEKNKEIKNVSLSKTEVQKLDIIKDEELKQAMKNFLIRCRRNKI